MGTLFALGFGLRWLFADGELKGDESWYFYLARTFGLESGARHEPCWYHIAHRPLYYAFFHPSTYAGLIGFRLLGCSVGAFVPVMAFTAARRHGATFFSAAFAASFLCLQAQHLKYSAAAMPDALASVFALAAVWAVAAQRSVLALVLGVCSVASKESFILIPAAVVLLERDAWLRHGRAWRPALRHGLAALIPFVYVGALAALSLVTAGLTLQGWADAPLTWRHARNMWLGPELLPLLGFVVWRRETRVLLLWLTLPLFYIGWTYVLGRGMAHWYVLGPAALSSVAAALTLDLVRAACPRAGRGWLERVVLLASICAYAPIPLYGLVRVRAQVAALNGRVPLPTVAPEVRRVIERERPSELLVVDCFWAFRYSHLRGEEPARAVWWNGPNDTEAVLRAAVAAPLIVACRTPGHELLIRRLQQSEFEQLHADEHYLVLAPLPR